MLSCAKFARNAVGSSSVFSSLVPPGGFGEAGVWFVCDLNVVVIIIIIIIIIIVVELYLLSIIWPHTNKSEESTVFTLYFGRMLRLKGGRAVYGVGLLRLPAEIVGSNPTGGHGCLSVVSVVCCEVEVCETSWSLVQRSPNDRVASLCVI